MDLAVHHVGIVVGDLERSKAFYGVLGFETVDEHVMPDKTIVFMRLDEVCVELFAYSEVVPDALREGRTLGFRHLAFSTADIDAAFADLRAGGVLPDEAQIITTQAGWRLLFFCDPDGVEIEVTQV